MNELDEEWRPVDSGGARYRYEVSSLGRVRNADTGRVLKPKMQPSQVHARVCLGRGGDRTVHSLVAEAFIGPRPAGMEVCHGEGGNYDNSAANLSYGTRAQNNGPDKRRDGSLRKGMQHYNARLSDSVVAEIKALYDSGEAAVDLAAKFGTSARNIRKIAARDGWRSESEQRAFDSGVSYALRRIHTRIRRLRELGEVEPQLLDHIKDFFGGLL